MLFVDRDICFIMKFKCNPKHFTTDLAKKCEKIEFWIYNLGIALLHQNNIHIPRWKIRHFKMLKNVMCGDWQFMWSPNLVRFTLTDKRFFFNFFFVKNVMLWSLPMHVFPKFSFRFALSLTVSECKFHVFLNFLKNFTL